MFDGLSGRRRAYVGSLAAIATVAVAAVVTANVGGDDGDTGEPTVIVVPGYGGDAASVGAIAAALEDAGREARVVVMPDRGTGDIRRSAAALDRAVGGATVDVVGFSAGGVIARYWIAELGGAAQARRVVTLGSPHHGTTIAEQLGALAGAECRGACAQLQPGSGLLDGLNATDETPAGPVWTAIWTARDQTVVPPESARLDGATNVRAQDCGTDPDHGGLARDRTVLSVAIRALNGLPADC